MTWLWRSSYRTFAAATPNLGLRRQVGRWRTAFIVLLLAVAGFVVWNAIAGDGAPTSAAALPDARPSVMQTPKVSVPATPTPQSVRFPADHPLIAYRAAWSTDCPNWVEETAIENDRISRHLQRCEFQGTPGADYEVLHMRYAVDAAIGRPPRRSAVATWTGPGGHRGTYYVYTRDEGRPALWLQDSGDPRTVTLLWVPEVPRQDTPARPGSRTDRDLITSLRQILRQHGYQLA